MADDYYEITPAISPAGGTIAGAVAQVYAMSDTGFTTPLAITDMSGVPLSALVASPDGIYPQFKVVSGEQKVIALSGDLPNAMTSVDGMRGLPGEKGDDGIGLPDPSTLPDGYMPLTAGGQWGVTPASTGGGGGGGGTVISPVYVVKWTGSGWPANAGIVPAGAVLRIFDAAGDATAVPYTGPTIDGVTDWFMRPEV